MPRISHCVLRRAGSLCCGHPRGADGRRGPGYSTCLGRRWNLRWPPMARNGGYPHWRLSVSAFQHCGPAQGRGRSPPSMAAFRADHWGVPTRMGVSGKRRQSSQHRISRGQRRVGRLGLRRYGRIVYGGRSRRAAQAPAAVHPRQTKPTGQHRGPVPTRTVRPSRRPRNWPVHTE